LTGRAEEKLEEREFVGAFGRIEQELVTLVHEERG